MTRQIHLLAHFPGVNSTTVWTDPAAGSQIDFASFTRLAQTAERGKFDGFFLAEGLSMREHAGHLHDLDVAGRPDSLAVLAALAAVTERIGLMATLTTTYHEGSEVGRQLGTLDHVSGGRAGWNLVTSTDPLTGENFRRGAHVAYADRYERGVAVLAEADARWAAWQPPLPQGRPVVIQAGDSEAGREFAARHADGIFTRHGSLEAGRAFSADVKGRLAAYGRGEDELLVLPGATFVLGDTDAEAAELAAHVRREQVSGPSAIVFLEQLWNRDLSGWDPDGPLPDVEPIEGEPTIAPGSIPARAFTHKRQATADAWREEAAAGGLSIRELMVGKSARQAFVGSPATVAAQIDEAVQARASDGFILIPYLTPGGLERFADEVVPLLQERGSFRADYEHTTFRGHLGL